MDIGTIRQALRRQPFHPFTLRLADGRRVAIPNVEFAALSASTVFVITPDLTTYMDIDPHLIVSMDYEDTNSEPSPSNPDQSNGLE